MAAVSRVTDPERVTAIQRLIRDQMRARDLSYGDVANASKDAEGRVRIQRNRVHEIDKKGIQRSPSQRAVEGLAAGLGVPLSTVKDAISECLNLLVIRDSTDPELAVYVDEIETLDPVRRQRYLRMARALLDEFKK